MNRTSALELLLAHYPDWLLGERGNAAKTLQGSRWLRYDQQLDCQNDNTGITSPFQLLDDTLTLMAKQGKQQAVRYERKGGPHDGTAYSCSLATARWHLLAWYIPDRYTQPRSYTRKRHGRNETIRPQPTAIRHPDAREDRAQAGLTWLNQHYDWDKAQPGLTWLRKNDVLKQLEHITGIAA